MALIELCTLQDVKTRVGKATTDTKDDEAIRQVIPAVSASIEDFIDRYVENTTHVEVFNVESRQRVFFLKGYPVSSITTVHNDLDRLFSTSTVVDSDEYTCNLDDGILYFEPGYPALTGWRVLQVTYAGGIAEDTDDLETTNEGLILREAALLQAAYLLRTRTSIGAVSEAGGELGSITWHRGDNFIPEVLAKLRPLQRGVS